MTVVALTGGIASGKTTVTEALTGEGIAVVDADLLAREAVGAGTHGFERIVESFGESVIGADGELDRKALGEVVFSDTQARELLNSIVHPEVQRLSSERFATHQAEHPDIPMVYAVPLLIESGRTEEFGAVVVVDAPREQRIERLVTHRGMSVEEASQRVDAQATDEERRSVADCLIDASVSLDHTREAGQLLAQALWECWPQVERLPTRLP